MWNSLEKFNIDVRPVYNYWKWFMTFRILKIFDRNNWLPEL